MTWLAPQSILVAIWIALPAVVSLGIGLRLLRPSRLGQEATDTR